jgi:hypothetical protein
LNTQRALLSRYLNGRLVSFDLDMLLATFAPYHDGIDRDTGKLALKFPDYPNRYEIRFDDDVVQARRTILFQISLPILASAFWFCVHCVMRDDYVSLMTPNAGGVLFANRDAPQHFCAEMIDASTPTRYIETVPELLSIVLDTHSRG